MASRDSLFLLSISFSFLLSSTDQTSRDVVDDCTIDVPAKTADALRTETGSPSHLGTETDSPALGTEPHSLLRVVPKRRSRRYTSYSQVTDDMSDSEVE